MNTLYDLSFTNTSGEVIELSQYRDSVLLIVNTATKCGLAPQLRELEELHKMYSAKGLVVIGFPCDQFAGQEPETDDTVAGVCQLNFGVTFMLSRKSNVNGKDTNPVFAYLKEHSPAPLGKTIKWNFTKFLVAPGEREIRRYAPTVSPRLMAGDIEQFLSGI